MGHQGSSRFPGTIANINAVPNKRCELGLRESDFTGHNRNVEAHPYVRQGQTHRSAPAERRSGPRDYRLLLVLVTCLRANWHNTWVIANSSLFQGVSPTIAASRRQWYPQKAAASAGLLDRVSRSPQDRTRSHGMGIQKAPGRDSTSGGIPSGCNGHRMRSIVLVLCVSGAKRRRRVHAAAYRVGACR